MSRRWLLRRVASSLVVLAAVLVLNFLLFRLMPGDAVSSIIDPSFSPEAKANLRAIYGLDRPLWEQFVIYIKQMLTFSFGLSFMSRRPVWDELLSRLPVTLTLTVSSMLISSLLGTWLASRPPSTAENSPRSSCCAQAPLLRPFLDFSCSSCC